MSLGKGFSAPRSALFEFSLLGLCVWEAPKCERRGQPVRALSSETERLAEMSPSEV